MADAGRAELPDSRPLDRTRGGPLLNENTRGELVFDPTFSPRGDQLVLRRNEDPSDLSLLSWPSREERWLTVQARPIGWSADGEWIYAIQDAVRALVRVSSRTGAPKTIGQFPVGPRIHTCDPTPARDTIVCSLTEGANGRLGDGETSIPTSHSAPAVTFAASGAACQAANASIVSRPARPEGNNTPESYFFAPEL